MPPSPSHFETPMTYQITNTISGVDLGVYSATTVSGALDAMARAAGYIDYRQACDVAPAVEGEIYCQPIEISDQ